MSHEDRRGVIGGMALGLDGAGERTGVSAPACGVDRGSAVSDSIRSEGLLPLTVTVSRPLPGVRLLRIAGELDIATAPLLAEHLRDTIGKALPPQDGTAA